MPAILSLVHDDRKYLFPVFKFLSSAHAEKLMNDGNVHVPQLMDFQNESKHGDKVLDREEAQVTIRNLYSHYDGLAKEANGVLPLYYKPYEHARFIEPRMLDCAITHPNAYGYCVTQHFFSDAVLDWAKDRKKETCVLVTDFHKFLTLVHPQMDAKNARFVDFGSCLYIGRTIEETNPSEGSLSNLLLKDPWLATL